MHSKFFMFPKWQKESCKSPPFIGTKNVNLNLSIYLNSSMEESFLLKKSNLLGGSFSPHKCDSRIGDLLFLALTLPILKTLNPIIDCKAQEALVTDHNETEKDTWTKPRGRVEVGERGGFSWGGVVGWEEKAHNCNWITIKKLKLKKVIKLYRLKKKKQKRHYHKGGTCWGYTLRFVPATPLSSSDQVLLKGHPLKSKLPLTTFPLFPQLITL